MAQRLAAAVVDGQGISERNVSTVKRKVIKPAADGHFEEVWEEQGRGAGQRHANSKAPHLLALATGSLVAHGGQPYPKRSMRATISLPAQVPSSPG